MLSLTLLVPLFETHNVYFYQKQSSTVETTEEESLNSAKNLESFSLIINFLQNLTEEYVLFSLVQYYYQTCKGLYESRFINYISIAEKVTLHHNVVKTIATKHV